MSPGTAGPWWADVTEIQPARTNGDQVGVLGKWEGSQLYSGARVVGEMPSGGKTVVVDWETAEIHDP
jgi:hypothetical protein